LRIVALEVIGLAMKFKAARFEALTEAAAAERLTTSENIAGRVRFTEAQVYWQC